MYQDENTLLGFHDVELGAAPVRRSPPKMTAKAASGGSSSLPNATIYGPAKKPKPSVVTKNHAQTIKAAKKTAGKAVNAALSALKAAKTTPKRVALKPGLKATGLKMTALGAVVPTTPKPLTPKAKAALDKQKGAVGKAAAAAKKAQEAGLRAKKAVINLAKKAKDQRAASLKIRRKAAGKTGIRGLVEMGMVEIGEAVDFLEQYYTAVGAAPDLNNPGFLDDGSPDPAYFGDPTAADPTAADPTAGMDFGDLFSGIDPLEQEPGPPLPPDAHIPDMNAVGGIPYDGSKGFPPGCVGSKSYFYQTIVNPKYPERRYGFVRGGDPHNPAWPGDNYDKWVWVHGKKGDSGSIPDFPGQEPGVSGWWDNADRINPSYADTASVAKASIAKGYGVLMGNPAFPDFTGMRVDNAGNLFWLPNEAPDWLTAPLKLAAEQTAKAEREAAAAAAAAEQAAIEKAKADAALAQAQQDAANALAESQAASEQRIAQAQQETQAQQLDIDQAKFDQQAMAQEQQVAVQQAQADMQQQQQASQLLAQQAQMELEEQRQAQQLLLEQARREQEYLAQHPEVEFAPQGGEESDGPVVEEAAEEEGWDGGFGDEGAEWG